MAEEITVLFTEAQGVIPVRLDGRPYRLDLRWNTRYEFWSIALLSSGGDPLMGHQRLTLLVDLLRSHTSTSLPPGALVAVDTSGRNNEPGREDLVNGRVKIVYLTEQEVADAS